MSTMWLLSPTTESGIIFARLTTGRQLFVPSSPTGPLTCPHFVARLTVTFNLHYKTVAFKMRSVSLATDLFMYDVRQAADLNCSTFENKMLKCKTEKVGRSFLIISRSKSRTHKDQRGHYAISRSRQFYIFMNYWFRRPVNQSSAARLIQNDLYFIK